MCLYVIYCDSHTKVFFCMEDRARDPVGKSSTRTVFQLPNYRTGYQLSYRLPAYVVGDESKYKAVTL